MAAGCGGKGGGGTRGEPNHHYRPPLQPCTPHLRMHSFIGGASVSRISGASISPWHGVERPRDQAENQRAILSVCFVGHEGSLWSAFKNTGPQKSCPSLAQRPNHTIMYTPVIYKSHDPIEKAPPLLQAIQAFKNKVPSVVAVVEVQT